MARVVPLEIRIADQPAMKQFIGATAGLLRALAGCEGLPETVMDAADEIRVALAALGVGDAGPPPSETEIIREAMTEAQAHPGRIVTR